MTRAMGEAAVLTRAVCSYRETLMQEKGEDTKNADAKPGTS